MYICVMYTVCMYTCTHKWSAQTHQRMLLILAGTFHSDGVIKNAQSQGAKRKSRQKKYKKIVSSKVWVPVETCEVKTVAQPSFIEVQDEEMARELREKEAVS